MKFTPEEISLCKQVAETDRLLKLAKEGDWIRNEYGIPSTDLATSEYLGHVLRFVNIKHWFSLWQIHDCLEFLRERGLRLLGLQQTDDDEYSCGSCETDDIGMRLNEETAKWADGKTPLEACLKAVLAVLEDEEK